MTDRGEPLNLKFKLITHEIFEWKYEGYLEYIENLEPENDIIIDIFDPFTLKDFECAYCKYKNIVRFKKNCENVKNGFEDFEIIHEKLRETFLSCNFSDPLLEFLKIENSKEIDYLSFVHNQDTDLTRKLVVEIDIYEDIIGCLLCDYIPQFGEFHFLYCCRKGLLDVAKFLYEKFNLSRYLDPLLELPTETELLEQKYLKNYKIEYIKNINNTFPMLFKLSYEDVVKSGNKDFFNWIYEILSNEENDIVNRSFGIACSEGNLEFVKYLINKFPEIKMNETLDISFDFGEYHTPFTLACYNGHIEIVKYLYEKIEIRKILRKGFRIMEFNNVKKDGIINYELKERRKEIMRWLFSMLDDETLHHLTFYLEHPFLKEYLEYFLSKNTKEEVVKRIKYRSDGLDYIMAMKNFEEVKFTFEELIENKKEMIEIVKMCPRKYLRYKKLFIGVKTEEDLEWLVRNELLDLEDFKNLGKKFIKDGSECDEYLNFLDLLKGIIFNNNLEVLRWFIGKLESEDIEFLKCGVLDNINNEVNNITINDLISLIINRRENIEYLIENELISYKFFEQEELKRNLLCNWKYNYENVKNLLKSWNWIIKKNLIIEDTYERMKEKFFDVCPYVIQAYINE